jgi:SAM-dependent methyltransferase
VSAPADSQAAVSDERVALAREAIARNPVWYHSIELAPGVVTHGEVDLRKIAARVLPDDLGGLRALDVGTFDGFWAFEMEARGADVVAIDVDTIEAAEWPPLNRPRLEATLEQWDLELGRGFRLAAAALNSSARRVPCNVYDVAPELIDGPVDFVLCGAVLLHLRDPVRALDRLRQTLRPGGRLLMLEQFSLVDTLRAPRTPLARFMPLSSDFTWWLPNLAAAQAWPTAAGFVGTRRQGIYHAKAPNRTLRGWLCAIGAQAPAA